MQFHNVTPTRWLLSVLVAFALTLTAVPAKAAVYGVNQCAADRLGSNLNCTAKDVSLTNMRVVGDQRSCVGGSTITLDLEVTANFGNANRYDFGIFIANDGKNPRITSANGGAASCSVNGLPTTSPFLDLDLDLCGDGGKDVGGGTGSGVVYMTNVQIPCRTTPTAGGKLTISYVATWEQNSGGYCSSSVNLEPGAGSKCSQQDELSEIVDVVVLPTISVDDGATFVTSGNNTIYTVVIQNLTGSDLSGVLFQGAVVAGLTANSISCVAGGGATCPTATVAALQGAGITLPAFPNNGTLTFAIDATLSGNQNDTVTNTLTVSSNGQTASASDTDTIVVGNLALSPSTSAITGSKGQTVTHTFTLYNFGVGQTINLSAVSSQGWALGVNPASVTVAGNGTATVTVTVDIPSSAAIGTVDATTITAQAGSDTATATAVTTVSERLTFTPDNASAGGNGASVYYSHRVQNNWSNSLSVSFSPVLTGQCTGWSAGIFASDKVTQITGPVTLTAHQYQDVFVKVSIPTSAVANTQCVVTTTASASGNTAQVVDTTTVKNLVLYSDPAYTNESYIYPVGNLVYAKAFGLTDGTKYFFNWYDPSNTLVRTITNSLTTGVGTSAPDTYELPTNAPFGRWKVEVWLCTNNNNCSQVNSTFFADTYFYVGPDHLAASYSGTNPTIGSNVVVDLALHDKLAHAVPMAGGSLVKGDATTKDPLKITVTVSGTATIVDDGTGRWSISGQTATGRLDDITGTATITIRNDTAETVTVTPQTFNYALYGSPARDEPATVTFATPPLHHIRLNHSGAGVTCAPSSVEVVACANADCSTQTPTSVTVALSPATGWTSNPVTFIGSTVVNLSSTTPGTVQLGTSAVSMTPSGASPRCYVGVTEDCNLVFSDVGFIVSDAVGGSEVTVPAQVAGNTSATYQLRAVKKNQTTQACEAALTGAKQVNFAYECNHPATCYANDMMAVNGGVSTIIPRNNSGSVTSYQAVDMTFDANGNAPFTVNYSDVGLVALHVNAAVNGATLLGASNAFVVKPAGFVVSNIVTSGGVPNPGAASALDTCGGTTPADCVFLKAGEAFSATVTAVTSGGAATPSYGSEGEGVKLSANLVGGLGLVNAPTLNNDSAFGAFANGSATGSTFSWDEVGIITLTPSVGDGNYLGAGDVTGAASGNVGRFIPSHFTVEATGGNLTPSCGGFAYTGQTMNGYTAAPAFKLTAQKLGGDCPTIPATCVRNYTGDFMRLQKTGLTFAAVTEDQSKFGVDSVNKTKVGRAVGAGDTLNDNGDGTVTYTPGADDYTYTRDANAQVAPYTAAVPLTIATVQDDDGVTALATATALLGGVEIRYGRGTAENTYGTAGLLGESLTIPVLAQYFNGLGQWLANADDNCTSVAYVRADDGITTAYVPGSPLTLIGGASDVVLTVTGDPDTTPGGVATLTFPAWPAWLPGPPTSTASFGVYRSDRRFIHWREN